MEVANDAHRVAIKRAQFDELEVDELTVRKLYVVENAASTG